MTTPGYFCLDNFGGEPDETAAIRHTFTAAKQAPAAVYSISGHRLATPQRGLNIIRMSDGTTRKVFIK